MLFVKNLPNWERVARVAGGAVAVWASLTYLPMPWSYVGVAAAVGGVLSGLMGFCPACAMVGRKLDASR
jgi:Protein of unknown function (DUF2892)